MPAPIASIGKIGNSIGDHQEAPPSQDHYFAFNVISSRDTETKKKCDSVVLARFHRDRAAVGQAAHKPLKLSI